MGKYFLSLNKIKYKLSLVKKKKKRGKNIYSGTLAKRKETPTQYWAQFSTQHGQMEIYSQGQGGQSVERKVLRLHTRGQGGILVKHSWLRRWRKTRVITYHRGNCGRRYCVIRYWGWRILATVGWFRPNKDGCQG